MSTTSVRPGQTVTFKYNGGTTPGRQRAVLVENTDGAHINGRDIHEHGYRTFLTSKIDGDVRVIAHENEEATPLSSIFLPDVLATLKGDVSQVVLPVYRLMNPERKGARYSDGYVVSRRTDLPRLELSITNVGITLDFVNEDGRKLGLGFNLPNPPEINSLPFRATCPVSASNLNQFAAELAEHAALSPLINTKADGWDDHVVLQQSLGHGMYAQ